MLGKTSYSNTIPSPIFFSFPSFFPDVRSYLVVSTPLSSPHHHFMKCLFLFLTFLLTAFEIYWFFRCTYVCFWKSQFCSFCGTAILLKMHCLCYYSILMFVIEGHDCISFFFQDQFNWPETYISIWILGLTCHFLWRFWKKLHWIICWFEGIFAILTQSLRSMHMWYSSTLLGFNSFR